MLSIYLWATCRVRGPTAVGMLMLGILEISAKERLIWIVKHTVTRLLAQLLKVPRPRAVWSGQVEPNVLYGQWNYSCGRGLQLRPMLGWVGAGGRMMLVRYCWDFRSTPIIFYIIIPIQSFIKPKAKKKNKQWRKEKAFVRVQRPVRQALSRKFNVSRYVLVNKLGRTHLNLLTWNFSLLIWLHNLLISLVECPSSASTSWRIISMY